MSIYLRFLLELAGQKWIKTTAHTSTIFLLPIIVYVITSVISGNIALSLGMVGALSIVRFRNPVRSPLELSLYFASITLGISAAVSYVWMFLLIGSITLVYLTMIFLNQIYKIFFNKSFFSYSFSEGNSLSTLNVLSHKEIVFLNDHKLLTSKSIQGNEFNYILASQNFEDLQNIETKINALTEIKSLNLIK